MADLFALFLPGLKAREGGAKFTNRAADRGGPTRWGITAAQLGAWRKLGRPATAAEVAALTEAEADNIYRSEYFVGPGLDQVAAVSPRIAEELLDTGVNMGPGWPSRWLQENLNLCNAQGTDYPDIKVDGDIGPGTVAALKALIRRRGQRAAEDLMLKLLNADQAARYKTITLAGGPNSDQERNFVGWISQRVGLPA